MPAVIRFFVFFSSFFSEISLRSYFFSEARFETRPFLCFSKKKLGWQANPTFFGRGARFLCCFVPDFFMYSSVGSILWEATVGRLVAGGVDGRG